MESISEKNPSTNEPLPQISGGYTDTKEYITWEPVKCCHCDEYAIYQVDRNIHGSNVVSVHTISNYCMSHFKDINEYYSVFQISECFNMSTNITDIWKGI
jgi:hypothetical protein